MIRHLAVAVAGTAIAFILTAAAEANWFFQPSRYTHEPIKGERVTQYSPGVTPYAHEVPNFVESGYRQMRTSIRGADRTSDNTHVVQTWGLGDQIRPYGEWQRPYRAGATPYGPWGNPQGPWTMPFDSWVNPYGQWNRWPPRYPFPTPYPPPADGAEP
jgi:hypothetical protein